MKIVHGVKIVIVIGHRYIVHLIFYGNGIINVPDKIILELDLVLGKAYRFRKLGNIHLKNWVREYLPCLQVVIAVQDRIQCAFHPTALESSDGILGKTTDGACHILHVGGDVFGRIGDISEIGAGYLILALLYLPQKLPVPLQVGQRYRDWFGHILNSYRTI